MQDERLMSVSEVATRLSVKDEMVRRLLRTGELTGVRLRSGRAQWRVRQSDLVAFIDSHTHKSSTAALT